MTDRRRYVIVDARDNVATAVEPLNGGEAMNTERGRVILLTRIPEGHKFALAEIPKDGYVVKYGEWIGRAKIQIPKGDHVHVHNVEDIVDEVRKR
jgi:altronate hydrolase